MHARSLEPKVAGTLQVTFECVQNVHIKACGCILMRSIYFTSKILTHSRLQRRMCRNSVTRAFTENA